MNIYTLKDVSDINLEFFDLSFRLQEICYSISAFVHICLAYQIKTFVYNLYYFAGDPYADLTQPGKQHFGDFA